MPPITFEFNVAFTLPVNNKNDPRVLTISELWQGIKHGGRNPHDFADYVASCEVISGNRRTFRRRLTLADGAVHTAAGATLDQEVTIADGLHVEGRTIDTGAKSTFFCSCGAGEGGEDEEGARGPSVYLTAAYELKLSNVQGNTKAAREIEVDYTALARGACRSAVEKIKGWKTEGKLEAWKKEDELTERAELLEAADAETGMRSTEAVLACA